MLKSGKQTAQKEQKRTKHEGQTGEKPHKKTTKKTMSAFPYINKYQGRSTANTKEQEQDIKTENPKEEGGWKGKGIKKIRFESVCPCVEPEQNRHCSKKKNHHEK